MSDLGGQLAERAAVLLGDGKWHDYETVLRDLIKLVPPGRAIRRTEKDRQIRARQAGYDEPPPRQRDRDVDDLIYTGARGIVRDFLNNTAFETNKKRPTGGNTPLPGRKIRMLRELRWAKGDPRQKRINDLKLQLERVTFQYNRAREQLISVGHKKMADQLLPELADELDEDDDE